MNPTDEDDWTDVVPWWLDAVTETDLVEVPEQFAVVGEAGPLSVGETLLAVAAVGPGVEAIRLLTSLAGQTLTPG